MDNWQAYENWCRHETLSENFDPASGNDQPQVNHARPDIRKLIKPDPAVVEALSAIAWANPDIPPETRLLGSVVTTSSRAFLVGSTGLGKTLFVYGMVGGMASGHGFLHWTCDRPSKWLVIDGEMPTTLVKSRAADMLRRAGNHAVHPNNILIYSRDRAEEFAQKFPLLGQLQPLNTEAGRHFVMDLIAVIGGVDGVMFDNLMSLAPGDQKDEETWAGCIPLVEHLSRAGIAQIWCDHTGHNSSRQYGSNTKSWRFDTVGIITPLSETDQPTDHVVFKLSFDNPGKARRRTPDNWEDFQPATVRLIDDGWIHEATGKAGKKAEVKLPDKSALLLKEIRVTLASHGRIQAIKEGAEPVVVVAREAVRKRLIETSWFADELLLPAFACFCRR